MRDQVVQTAAVALALGNMFREAMDGGGRRVVELIFSLHNSLHLGNSINQDEIRNLAVRPLIAHSCRRWWDCNVRPGSPWRPVLIRWIDYFSERLTMPAYADPRRRMHHAVAFLADPLRLIAASDASVSPPVAPSPAALPPVALDRLAEQWLNFWDLLHAAGNATRGLNRILIPSANHMGGFFALDENVTPPAMNEILRAAEVLRDQMRRAPPPPLHPDLDDALLKVHDCMIAALDNYVRGGQWPDWAKSSDKNLLSEGLRRLRNWFS
jgi:hypothetical protein